MAIDFHKAENNQQIFDSCVRSVLDHCEVPQIDQPIEGLLESIEHGEGSVDTALNLVVAAHVAHLFLEVHLPIEEPEWTDALRRLKPGIEDGLELCRELLIKSLPNSARIGDKTDRAWFAVIPQEYGMQPWMELKDSGLLKCDMFGICFIRDGFLFQLKQQEPVKRIELSTLAREFGDSGSRMDSFVKRSTVWHRFVVADAIHAFLEEPKGLEWEEWCALVDLCSELMQGAEPATESPMDDMWTPTSQIRLSPKSAEYWAWEFGRVAAMWPLVDKTTFDSHESDYFYNWSNGLAALSLQLGASGSDEDLFDRCWTGAAVASGLNSESGRRSAYPDEQSPSDPLFWLMRLGFLYGSRRIESSGPVLSASPGEPSDGNMLMVGDPNQLGRGIVESLAASPRLSLLGSSLKEAFDAAEQQQEVDIRVELARRLGGVWDRLPPDSQDHLLDAELDLRKRERPKASLSYANAVETALSDWLPPPRGQRDWPEGFGDWVDVLRGMTKPSKDRHRLDKYLRQRCDLRYASDLLRALDVLREARLSGAHGKLRPPYAKKVQQVVFGGGHNGQRLGVFELILRFAKR